MNKQFLDELKKNPIIPAIRTTKDLEHALKSKSKVVFLLNSDILEFSKEISVLKKAGKYVFIHTDLINGLSTSPFSIEYINKVSAPYGILTTKRPLITKAKALNLLSILRVFALDSTSITSAIKLIKDTSPDAVEVLPGTSTKAVKLLKSQVATPIITGGLVDTKEEVEKALKAGAAGISTSMAHILEK